MCPVLKRFLVLAFAFLGMILAQGAIDSYTGNDALFTGSGELATSAHLVAPNNIAVDSHGNVCFSASGLSMVPKVATNGIISVVGGNGLSADSGDGGLAQ